LLPAPVGVQPFVDRGNDRGELGTAGQGQQRLGQSAEYRHPFRAAHADVDLSDQGLARAVVLTQLVGVEQVECGAVQHPGSRDRLRGVGGEEVVAELEQASDDREQRRPRVAAGAGLGDGVRVHRIEQPVRGPVEAGAERLLVHQPRVDRRKPAGSA
jgi:hypothetical protein